MEMEGRIDNCWIPSRKSCELIVFTHMSHFDEITGGADVRVDRLSGVVNISGALYIQNDSKTNINFTRPDQRVLI